MSNVTFCHLVYCLGIGPWYACGLTSIRYYHYHGPSEGYRELPRVNDTLYILRTRVYTLVALPMSQWNMSRYNNEPRFFKERLWSKSYTETLFRTHPMRKIGNRRWSTRLHILVKRVASHEKLVFFAILLFQLLEPPTHVCVHNVSTSYFAPGFTEGLGQLIQTC